MAQLQEILAHPDFIELPDSEKQKALGELIPGFGDLPQSEQLKGMAEIMGRVNQSALPAPATPVPADPTAESLGMFQPGNLLPSMETIREQAPIAGAMVTAPFRTSPILAPISGMGASAAALMAGQGTEPMGPTDIPDVTGASLNQFNAPGTPFLMGMGAEGAGQAALGMAGKVLAPFKNSFAAKLAGSPEMKMAQELVDKGVPLSPGGYGGAKRFQWIADNFTPGSLIVNKRRQEVADAILKMRQEFIQDSLGLPKFTESIPQAQAKTRELFGKFKGELGGDVEATIPMPNAVKYIEDNAFGKLAQSDPKKWWTKRLIPWAKGGEEKTLTEVNTINASYNRYWTQLTPDQQKLRLGLHDAYMKDLADWDMRTGFQLEKSLNAAQESSKQRYDIVKSRWLENALLGPATPVNKETGQYTFYPAMFRDQINKNLTKIERMFGQSGLDIINRFADKMMLAVPDVGKLGKVSDATNAMRKATGFGMLTIPGAIAAGSTGTAAALAVPYGFQTIVAKSLMNPSGWLRKWLTTGLSPSKLLTKEAPKLGIMEATNAD